MSNKSLWTILSKRKEKSEKKKQLLTSHIRWQCARVRHQLDLYIEQNFRTIEKRTACCSLSSSKTWFAYKSNLNVNLKFDFFFHTFSSLSIEVSLGDFFSSSPSRKFKSVINPSVFFSPNEKENFFFLRFPSVVNQKKNQVYFFL